MKEKLIKYSYYLMIIIMIVIATYVLINWLIPLFFSCLIVLVLQPLLAKEIKLLKIENIFLSKCLIVFNYLFYWCNYCHDYICCNSNIHGIRVIA